MVKFVCRLRSAVVETEDIVESMDSINACGHGGSRWDIHKVRTAIGYQLEDLAELQRIGAIIDLDRVDIQDDIVS